MTTRNMTSRDFAAALGGKQAVMQAEIALNVSESTAFWTPGLLATNWLRGLVIPTRPTASFERGQGSMIMRMGAAQLLRNQKAADGDFTHG
jgi:hypothetical protein